MSSVDIRNLTKALKAASFNGSDLLNVEGAGAYTLVNGMRRRVAVDTAATRNSIMPHVTEATETFISDEIGPETNYAPYIEYGVQSKPNYPVQPFVRPTAQEDFQKVVRVIGVTFGAILVSRWPK